MSVNHAVRGSGIRGGRGRGRSRGRGGRSGKRCGARGWEGQLQGVGVGAWEGVHEIALDTPSHTVFVY